MVASMIVSMIVSFSLFVVREVDVQPGHDELELGAGHEPVAVFVEHTEGLKNNLTFNYSQLGYTDIG